MLLGINSWLKSTNPRRSLDKIYDEQIKVKPKLKAQTLLEQIELYLIKDNL